MSRYIDADLIEKELTENGFYELDKIPTADVVPVKHGHWIELTDYVGDTYYDCSACGESWTTIEGDPWDNGMNYCPKCGTKMDEVLEDE